MKESYWQATEHPGQYGRLKRNLKTDVLVVGAGITGITAAYLLKRAGLKVVLLERDRCLDGETGRTTAHLTCQTDLRLADLVKNFGADHARAAWDAGLAAIDLIEENAAREGIDCDFRRVPGYLHGRLEDSGQSQDDRDSLMRDTQLAVELGFDARYLESAPVVRRPAMCLANQAKFHPLKYLTGLLATIDGDGSHVFEESEAAEFSEQPLSAKSNGHTIECGYVVIATHAPLTGTNNMLSAMLFQSKLIPSSSYVIGATLPLGSLPEACFWDTSDPYYYLRIDRHPKEDYLIFGGRDHKTGQLTETGAAYAALETVLQRTIPGASVKRRWSGQVIDTSDGLPFIGEFGPGQFISTGYAGNGMTFGTLGGLMAFDAVTARKNPWRELFDPHRKKIMGSAWDYIRENLDYPYYLLRDRLKRGEGENVNSVKPGEGKILILDGQRVAAHRDNKGKLTVLSATCTHMGCIVHWNAAEKTWDCPCHGSRFKTTGEVLSGPAEAPLENTKAPQPKS